MSTMKPLNRRPMQHIDRRELYTSLETRIQYLHSFLDFSSRTFKTDTPFNSRLNLIQATLKLSSPEQSTSKP
jgi:hypothetical protein